MTFSYSTPWHHAPRPSQGISLPIWTSPTACCASRPLPVLSVACSSHSTSAPATIIMSHSTSHCGSTPLWPVPRALSTWWGNCSHTFWNVHQYCSQYGSPPPQQGYDELSSQTRWRVRIFACGCLFVQSSWIWSYLIWFSLIPSFFGFIILWMCVHMFLFIVLHAHAFTCLLCINAQCATGRRHMPLPGVSWTGYIITNIVLLCKRIFFVIIIRGIINCAFLNECESVSSHPMPLVAMSADDAKKVPIHRSPDMTDNISIIIFPSDHGMASVWWSGHTFLSRNIGIVS